MAANEKVTVKEKQGNSCDDQTHHGGHSQGTA